MKIGEAVYKAQSEQAAPAAGARVRAAKPGEKVVDAEFEEVDEPQEVRLIATGRRRCLRRSSPGHRPVQCLGL